MSTSLPEQFQIINVTDTDTEVTFLFIPNTVLLHNTGGQPLDFTTNGAVATFRGPRLPANSTLTIDRTGQVGKITSLHVICGAALSTTLHVTAWV